MCGIIGEFFKITPSKLDGFLGRVDRIKHRGPNGQGISFFNKEKKYEIRSPQGLSSYDENLKYLYTDALAHVRLSIIDHSQDGLQPFVDGDLSLAFNGEIYNYIEIREELRNLGYEFSTDTDTEVVLKSYIEWGTDCFRRFNGMWGVCIYNRRKETVTLSRDRFGVKPLYYMDTDTSFFVASEIKALDISFINNDFLALFLEQNYIDFDKNTLYESVYQVEPSTVLIIDKLRAKTEFKYFDVDSYEEKNESVCDLIYDSIKLRNRADVKIGGLLSGGIDSSVIAGVTKKFNSDYKLFSAVFNDGRFCEKKYIQKTEEYLNLDVEYLTPEVDKLSESVAQQVYIQESPLRSMAQIYQYQLYKYISENTDIKVVFNGQGADETFSGYNEHIICYYLELLRNFNFSKFSKEISEYRIISGLSRINILRKIISLALSKPKKPKVTLLKSRSMLPPRTLQNRLKFNLMCSALPEYLKYDDRNSMAVGIESRLPFLDYRLVMRALSISPELKISEGIAKIPLREIARKDKLVDPKVLDRKDKAGFVSPQDIYMRTELKKDIIERINNIKKYNQFFNVSAIDSMIYDFLNDNPVDYNMIFRLYTTSIWIDKYNLRFKNEA
ncbi:asparagine synthase (glutamine-hydrolyzing) [Aliivibrio fischeri]